jgi:DNA-binding response OmpR family regulator
VTSHRTVYQSAPHKQVKVVVVEEALVSKLVRTVLQKHGFSAVSMGATEAEGMLRSAETSEDILLTNSPSDFLELSKKIPLLYLTSSPDPALQIAFRSCRVVRKPFSPNELVEAAKELAGK